MDDYLSKPLRPEELHVVIERWVGTVSDPPERREEAIGALVDEARMRTFRDDYPEIVEQLVELFAESSPPLIGELRVAVESADAAAIGRSAHKLKGSCQNIGATRMADLCRTLEAGETDPLTTLAELEAAFSSTEAAIRQAVAA
jgi:HPt (histidine-containing phosphotransfer) domain-containing protein